MVRGGSALRAIGLCASGMKCPLRMVRYGMSSEPNAPLDALNAEVDLAYAVSVLEEAREALGSTQAVTVAIAPLEHKGRYLNREDPAAMSMRWIGPKSPAQLRVDPMALSVLPREVLKLGLLQQLARMPYERTFNALAAVAGPLMPIMFVALWWFGSLGEGIVFLIFVALVAFPVVSALLRWSVYRSDRKALQACNGDVESFKMLLSFDDWNENDVLREGAVVASRLPSWLDCQPSSAARLKRIA